LEKNLYVLEGKKRRFIAYRGRKIEDHSNQWSAIADFALAFDRGHPSRGLFFTELLRSSGVGI